MCGKGDCQGHWMGLLHVGSGVYEIFCPVRAYKVVRVYTTLSCACHVPGTQWHQSTIAFIVLF